MHHQFIYQIWCLFNCHVRLMMPHLPAVTLGNYTPHPYHMPNQSSERVTRNPTIRISRATRVTQWNVSLDREITDSKELRNLDEFLGNQVRSSPEEQNLKRSRFLTQVLFIALSNLDTHMALACLYCRCAVFCSVVTYCSRVLPHSLKTIYKITHFNHVQDMHTFTTHIQLSEDVWAAGITDNDTVVKSDMKWKHKG